MSPDPETNPDDQPVTRTVRTTMQPDTDIEVDNLEYTELVRQGLVADKDETTLAERSAATEHVHGNLPAAAIDDADADRDGA